MLFAEHDTAFWVAMGAIVTAMVPVFLALIAGYLKLREMDYNQKQQALKINTDMKDQTEKIEDAQKERLKQTNIIVGATKDAKEETKEGIKRITESQLVPQKVEVVNKPGDPVQVVETKK